MPGASARALLRARSPHPPTRSPAPLHAHSRATPRPPPRPASPGDAEAGSLPRLRARRSPPARADRATPGSGSRLRSRRAVRSAVPSASPALRALPLPRRGVTRFAPLRIACAKSSNGSSPTRTHWAPPSSQRSRLPRPRQTELDLAAVGEPHWSNSVSSASPVSFRRSPHRPRPRRHRS